MEEIMYRKQHQISTDKDGNTVFLADKDYMINLAKRIPGNRVSYYFGIY